MEDKSEQKMMERALPLAATMNGNYSHDSKFAEKNDPNLVQFAPNALGDPRNWSAERKWTIILSITIANFTVIIYTIYARFGV